MGRTACTEPQCLYKGVLYLTFTKGQGGKKNPKKKKKDANWIVHILSGKWLLKHVTEGKIEWTGTRGRRRKHLLDDLK